MSIYNEKIQKIIGISFVIMGGTFIVLKLVSKMKKGKYMYNNVPGQQNLLVGKKVVFVQNDNDPENADGVRGHLEPIGDVDFNPSFYDRFVKRAIDVILSLGGLVVLSPIYAVIALAIVIDDPGPVFFTQKRMGQNKEYFKLHKFRSMKMSTPHDVPTHMLENPEQYITRVGKFLRTHSLDELPQIWDIFIGNMSVIGPRPGLWNQDVLTAERDKYGANNVKPGLTGWAQINGRDELDIAVKAKLDGEYVKKESLLFDMKCFLGTVGKLAKDNSVVEGCTGKIKKNDNYFDDTGNDSSITVSIVTYNSSEEIPILMDSLKNCHLFDKLSVYVVDNASSDDTVEIIKREYPWVKLYEGRENLGFGRAHNIVINHVKSKYHIIVNPDIRVEVDTFEKIIEYMDKNIEVAVATPYVKNTDGTQQYLPKKNPSMKYMIGGMFEKYSSTCRNLRNEYTIKNKVIKQPIDVEFCSGCFMITRTDALHKVGGFDDIFFLHFEDADLTRELRKIGRAVYNPNIMVTHKWERDNRKINKSFWAALKSMFIYMRKWRCL